VLFWGTPLLQFIPWREYAVSTVRSGSIPLWNPLLGAGAPLLANYQSALLYPPNWLLLLVDVAWGHGLLVLLHLALAGVGMALLGRRLGLADLPAAVAGLAYSMSAFLVARSGFFSINSAAAWTPWVIWSVESLLQPPHSRRHHVRGSMVLAAVLTAQWLAGHAQTSWYTLVMAMIWWLVRGLHGSTRPHLLRLSFWALGGSALAFALASPQLLPTAEYLINSQRSTTIDPSLGLTYSFWPWRSLELLFPGMFGHPAESNYWGYANYWEDAIYIGTLPFLMALLGLHQALAGDASQKRMVRLLLLLSLCAAALSLGSNSPIYRFLFDRVPTFNLFQAPTRWNLVTVFSLAVLAGLGVQSWKPARGRALYWLRLGTAGAGAIAMAAVIAASAMDDVQPTFIRAFSRSGLLLVSAGGLALTLRERKRAWWVGSVLTLVVLDLVWVNAGNLPFTDRDLYAGSSRLAQITQDGSRIYMRQELEHSLKFATFFRFDSSKSIQDWRSARDVGLPNVSLLDRVPSANNFDPLLPDRFQGWTDLLEGMPAGRFEQMLRLMGAGWLARAGAEPDRVGYVPVGEPMRAVFYAEAESVADGPQVLQRLQDPDLDPTKYLLVEGAEELDLVGGRGRVLRIVDASPNEVIVEVQSEKGGWLYLADTYYPGWKAELGGDDVEIHRAQYLFRAVRVPGGRHTVHFQYRPLSFAIGLGLSAIGFLLFFALLIWVKWRS
jgi:hypothetical protein